MADHMAKHKKRRSEQKLTPSTRPEQEITGDLNRPKLQEVHLIQMPSYAGIFLNRTGHTPAVPVG